LSDRRGTAQLLRERPGGGSAASNFGNTWLAGPEEASGDSSAPDGATESAGVAQLARLDDFALPRRPDVVKIDVEGAEFLVLRGAEATLRRYKPTLLCELFPSQLRKVSGVSVGDVVALLDSWGYQSFRLDGTAATVPWTLQDMPAGDNAFVNVVFR
jgi:Methyltransferase FkbM domain